MLVEQVLEEDPFSGHMFVFRGKRADMIKDLKFPVPCEEFPVPF